MTTPTFRAALAVIHLIVLPTSAAVVDATFNSPTDVPITAASYTATGNTVNFTLNHTPDTGANLTVVNNTGLGFITGAFTNLAQGQKVSLTYAGITYTFVANYYGGTGNDLVLLWAHNRPMAWGFNYNGQLGDNTTYDSNLPVAVTTSGILSGKTLVAISTSGFYLKNGSVALCSDGTVAAWGYNYYGQLGNNSTSDSSVPVDITFSGILTGKKVVAVAAGGSHSLALCSDGTVAAWGSNSYGQLGNGSTTNTSEPLAVTTSGILSGKTVVAIAAGGSHSLALCSDGTVAAWGSNSYGQLGNGSTTNTSEPLAVTGILATKTVVAIAAGESHNLALCSDGTVVAWGNNGYGRLGNGSITSSSVQVDITTSGILNGKTVVSLAAGGSHSLALCSDGTVAAWGYNSYGQLGNNSTTNSSVPVSVTSSGVLAGRTVVAIAAGDAHSLALCSDGTVAAWGNNIRNQLGNNSATNSSVPVVVSVAGLATGERFVAARTAAGSLHNLAIVASPPWPVVSTADATSLSNTGATLNGVVNANSNSTTVSFEYGLTTSYGSLVEGTPSSLTGMEPTAVSAHISSLTPCTTYHYRVSASNALGTVHGEDMTFVTAPYTFTTNHGTISITKYTGPGGAVSIPSTITGLPVTSIGSSAFQNNINLTSVTIPGSVTSIGDYAFQFCTNLTCVTIPDSVTGIGSYAFDSCTMLTSVTIGTHVTSIGDFAFQFCPSLTSVTIPNSVLSVGERAFRSCTSLTSVAIGSSTNDIGSHAFSSCTSLSSIAVDETNPNYSSVDGVLFDKWITLLVQYPTGRSATYTIPNGVQIIGSSAFSDCSGLSGILIPNSVTCIANQAFRNCGSLMDVMIPESVTSIEDQAFYSCDDLTNVMIGSNVTDIGVSAFQSCKNLTGVYFKGNAPDIGDLAFLGATHATVYYLPMTTGWSANFGGLPTVLRSGPPVLSNPANRTNVIGATATFAVTATSTLPLSYQWRKNDTNLSNTGSISGATTATLTLANVQPTDAGNYSVVVTDAYESVTSTTATLTVIVDPLATAVDNAGLVWTTGGDAPWFAQITTTYDGVDAARSGAITDNQESWMQTTLTGSGTLSFWWKVSSEDTWDVLEFYLDGVLQSDPITGETGWQQRTFTIPPGSHTVKWRYVKDDSISSGLDTGWVDLVTFVPDVHDPPNITTQPVSCIKVAGSTAMFYVTATGTEPLAYQWRKNETIIPIIPAVGVPGDPGYIPSSASAQLTLTHVQLVDVGSYSVVVSNAYGSVTSTPASLTLVPPVVTTSAASWITASSATLNGTVNPNGLTSTARFDYGLTSAYGSKARVTLSPDNGTSAQAVIAGISGLQSGKTYHYRVTATSGAGTSPGEDMTFATPAVPIAAAELVAPKMEICNGKVNFTVQASVPGRGYQLQCSDTMAPGTWQDLGPLRIGNGGNLVIITPCDPEVRRRFYRLALQE